MGETRVKNMSEKNIKFAKEIIELINNSYTYWVSSHEVKAIMEKPFFDKNQTLKLLKLYNKINEDSYNKK